MNNKAVNNKADRYIEDVLRRVVLPSARKDDLRADLREHFAAAEEGREPVEEVIQRLGEPEEVAASFMEGVELRFAGIWPRFVALCADVGFCSLVAIPAVTFGYVLSSAVNNDAAPFYSFILFCVFAFFCLATFGVFLLYFPILEHFFGWTLGKKLMKIRVVSEQGGPVSLGAAVIRRLPFYFELIWLDGIFAPFTEKKQRAFDIVAKTVVVREPDTDRMFYHYLLCLIPWIIILSFICLCMAIGAAS